MKKLDLNNYANSINIEELDYGTTDFEIKAATMKFGVRIMKNALSTLVVVQRGGGNFTYNKPSFSFQLANKIDMPSIDKEMILRAEEIQNAQSKFWAIKQKFNLYNLIG